MYDIPTNLDNLLVATILATDIGKFRKSKMSDLFILLLSSVFQADYYMNQWLRLWLLGGPEIPKYKQEK